MSSDGAAQKVNILITPNCMRQTRRVIGVGRGVSVLGYLNANFSELRISPDREEGWYRAASPDSTYVFLIRPPRKPFARDEIHYVAAMCRRFGYPDTEPEARVNASWI